jgi:hypothetical protein
MKKQAFDKLVASVGQAGGLGAHRKAEPGVHLPARGCQGDPATVGGMANRVALMIGVNTATSRNGGPRPRTAQRRRPVQLRLATANGGHEET